jgi:hypothetical protein
MDWSSRPVFLAESASAIKSLSMILPVRWFLAFLIGPRSAPLLFLLIGRAALAADPVLNWPQFRGPDAMGIADNPDLPDRWSTNENVAWKIEMPGRGWSSPIVWGERRKTR